MNAFATVGDIALQVSGKSFNSATFSQDIKSAQGIDIIDELPTTAGTRISKSREGSGRSPLALSWRGNSVPGLYMLPDDTIKAALTMGNSLTGENPARGMLASSLVDKTYVDPALKGEKARIPGDIVKIIEDKLDAEYVPFYFHDLRTNEIISFHAFLENLSETFAAQYNSYKSYGRTDAVKTYGSTNRTISFSFTVASTSRDDFDEMWFKLNRLIASTYPKYTPGQQVKTGDVTFQQPFSQVVGATPLMRLRVGDVIKSNYSRFNLARFFGIGSDGTDVSAFDASKKNSSNAGATQNQQQESVKSGYDKWKVGAFYTIFGSPLKTLESTQSKDALSSQISTNIASNVLVNGFVNPVGYALMTNFSRSPDTNYASNLDANLGVQQSIAGYRTIAGGIVYIKPRERPYDVVDSSGNNIIGKAKIRRQVRAIVLGRNEIQSNINESDPSYQSSYKIDNNSLPRKETQYRVRIIDFGTLIPASRQLDGITEGDSLLGEYLLVTHDELLPDLSAIFSSAAVFTSPIASTADALLAAADSLASALNLNVSSIIDNAAKKGVEGFMSPNNNGIVRAFENNRGRGLAGVITNLQFNWLEFPWETDWGARAPMGAKVTISFECMHDLPPGLDASGYMRAPTHNVGSVMNTIAGDPYDDKGDVSRTNFTNSGASNIVKKA
jgi:hypothetical protein